MPQGDAGAFAAAVRALLDSGRRAAFGQAARRRALARHDIAAAGRLDAMLADTFSRFRAAAHKPIIMKRAV